MHRIVLVFALLGALVSGACGLKGDLYLEEEAAADTVPANDGAVPNPAQRPAE